MAMIRTGASLSNVIGRPVSSARQLAASIYAFGYAVALLLVWLSPGIAQSLEPKRLVLAHYMVCCPIAGPGASVEDHLREMRVARASGIDGFSLNLMSYPGSPSFERHSRTVEKLFIASLQVPNFYLVFSFDQISAERSIFLLSKYSGHPNYLRRNGALVVSGWGQTPGWVEGVRKWALNEKREVFIIPHVNYPLIGTRHAMSSRYERNYYSAKTLLDDVPSIDGVFVFGPGGNYRAIANSYRRISELYHQREKVVMLGITGFYRGINDNSRVFESDGFEGVRLRWLAAIESGADWVQFVTWNDWDEATYFQPFDAPSMNIGNQQNWQGMPDHGAFLQASRYYIDWFKSGTAPKIVKDEIFYFYRPHLADKSGVVDYRNMRVGRPQNWESLQDKLYLVSYLTGPRKLKVDNGGKSHTVILPSGVGGASLPLSVGELSIESLTGDHAGTIEHLAMSVSGAPQLNNFNYFSGQLSISTPR